MPRNEVSCSEFHLSFYKMDLSIFLLKECMPFLQQAIGTVPAIDFNAYAKVIDFPLHLGLSKDTMS